MATAALAGEAEVDDSPTLNRTSALCGVGAQGGASTPTPGGMVIGMRRLSTLGGASLFTPQLSRQNSFTRQLGMKKTPLDFEPFQANYGSSLPEARLRLLTVLKHVYWGCFQNGLLSPTGLRSGAAAG